MKLISRLWNLLILSTVLALIFHNLTAKLVLQFALRSVLGVPASIGRVELSFPNTSVLFRDIEMGNPSGLPQGKMARIPKIFLDFEVSSIFEGRIHFETVEIVFEELRVIRFPEGINLLSLKSMESSSRRKDRREAQSRPVQFQIDELVLTLGRATYMDLTGATPLIRNVEISLKEATYRDIHGLGDIVKVVTWETLKRMALPGLGNILNQIGGEVGLMPGGAKGVFEKAVLAMREKL